MLENECPDGQVLTLKKDKGLCEGFPYLDIKENKQAIAMIQTVRDNYEGYTKREVQEATLARKAQLNLGCPTEKEFAKMVSSSSGVSNIPIDPIAVTHARAIFGPDLPNKRGKEVRGKPDRVDTALVKIPADLARLHHVVTLTADVMFVNGVAFLVTLSRKLRLVTAEHIPTRTAAQLSSSLNKIVRLYQRGGFNVNVILMDQEFDKVEGELGLVEVNTSAD